MQLYARCDGGKYQTKLNKTSIVTKPDVEVTAERRAERIWHQRRNIPPPPRDSPPPPNPPGRSLGSINHVASSRHPTPHQEQRLVSDSLLGSQTVAPRISLDFMLFKWMLYLKVIDLLALEKKPTKLCWSKKCLRF